MTGPVYEFDGFRLDCGRFELLRDERSLRIERKPMELLILLVSRGGELVTRTEISQRLWDQEVFVDTEHGINTAVRKIRTVLGDDPEKPRFLQTVTGMGYRFIAPVEVKGAIPAGEPQEIQAGTVASSAPAHPAKVHLKWWLAGGAVAITSALLLVVTVGPHPLAAGLLHRSQRPVISSVAVLPLENLSGDAGQSYFADGMTDEITTMLARNSTLRIPSRTSAMQFKEVHRPLREIASALNVDAIVEGSVERRGNQVHMTLQLVQGESDTHLWANSYDRNADDATLPADAAHDIAQYLHAKVAGSAVSRYVSPEAHDAYLHGWYLWYGGWQQNEKAGAYFKKAVELQPDYAAAWAGLSAYYGQGAITGDFNPNDSLVLMESAAAKAVALDDSLPEAHLVMSASAFLHRWDWVTAQREIKRAIELDPRFAEAYHLDAVELSVLNRHGEAIEAQKKSNEFEPFAHPSGLLRTLTQARQFDAALEDAKQRLEVNPKDLTLLYLTYDVYRREGRGREAVAAIVKLNQAQDNLKEATAVQQAYDRGGYKAVVRRELSKTQEASKKGYTSPMEFAVLYAQLGDRERTLSLLEAGFREHSPHLLWIQTEPAYDFLHTDPRYRALVQRIGLPPAY